MPELDTLDLVPARRHGGGGRTAVDYLDFVVSGTSLLQRLGWGKADLVGCLGWGASAYQDHLVQQLLLRQPSELASGRYMLYVCGECGDIGCGAITAVVSKESEGFVWRDFGFENNYEETIHHLADFASVGPFSFGGTAYWQAFQPDHFVIGRTI